MGITPMRTAIHRLEQLGLHIKLSHLTLTMKDLFPEYYKGNYIPSHDRRWDKSAFFIFDANILLNLYGFRKATRNKWFEAMAGLSDRIFMPYQVAVEYHRNLKTKIDSVKSLTASEATALFAKSETSQPLAKYHPLSSLNEELKSAAGNSISSKKKTAEAIDMWKKEFDSEWLEIRDHIASLFTEAKLGAQPSKEQIKNWCEMGKQRYESKIPPGYKDQNKGNNVSDDGHKYHSGNKFGDLFVWQEILAESLKRDAPAIFVSAEKKPDWVRKNDADEYVARYELSTEFLVTTGHEFEFATDERFYRWAELKHGEVEGGSEEVRATVAEKKHERQNLSFPNPTLLAGIDRIHSETEKICALLEISPVTPSTLIEELHGRGLVTSKEHSSFVYAWHYAKATDKPQVYVIIRQREAYHILARVRRALLKETPIDYEDFDLEEDQNRDGG